MGNLRKFSLVALTAAVIAVPVTAPRADASAVPQATITLQHRTVQEPGTLTLTVHASGCVAHVEALAAGLGTETVLRTVRDRHRGRVFRLRIRLAGVPAGRYAVDEVTARPCGTGPGVIPLGLASFPAFRVLPPASIPVPPGSGHQPGSEG